MSNQQHHIEQLHRISKVNDIAVIKKQVDDYQQWLKVAFEELPITKIVLGRSFYVDCLVRHLWSLYKLDKEDELMLAAVGGYGRGHLNFHSDIDLLILYKNNLSKDCQDKISQFITLLWDIGLDIGQSVRSIKETISQAKDDITIATNLLEARYLIGCHATFDKLNKEMNSRFYWSSSKFFTAKHQEQKERHRKFNGISYNLEPNIKENPGGLRDIQMIGWVAKKHFKVVDGNELVQENFLKPEELLELQDCRKFLWRLRCALHVTSGRSENRLLFEYQPEIAKILGYGDDGKSSVEKMMKEYFIIARRISELNEMLLQYFEEEILGSFSKWRSSKLSDDFDIYHGLLRAKSETVFDSPEKVLNLFMTIAQSPQIEGLHSITIRQLRAARQHLEQGDELCQSESCREIFKSLIKHPDFFGLAWDLMHKYGIMAIYSKGWAHIVGLMQFDLFHEYTVDEHTHRLIKNIHNYTLEQYKDEFPRCRSICHEYPKMDILYIAAIHHDICKGMGGDHSELGAVAVKDFMLLHDYSEFDATQAAWLVDNHLLIPTVAQRKDIHDPDVIDEFIEVVQDETHLSLLYVLTIADIRATNKSLYNQWKASLMRDLFLITQKVLRSGRKKSLSLPARVEQRKTDALAIAQSKQHDQQHIKEIWQSLDEDYFVRYKPEQIIWHCEQIFSAKENQPIISVCNEFHRGGTSVFVYCKDKPSLFAKIASALDRKNFNVHSAEILSNNSEMTLDNFIILENDDSMVEESRFNDVIHAVKEAIDSDTIAISHARVPRKIKHFEVPTRVYCSDDLEKNRTIMEIEALDMPGLLAKIGRVFFDNKINIHTAKVSTIGERAEDFFIVTNNNDEALNKDEKDLISAQLRKELTL